MVYNAPRKAYIAGYDYLGGYTPPATINWVSPQRLIDDPTLALVVDMNDYADPSYNVWTLAPHGARGLIQRGPWPGFINPGGGKNSAFHGAQGGNVGLLDGSVAWKPIGLMITRNTAWTAAGAFQGYYGAW